MYFNPPTPGNNPTNPFWHPLNQRMNPQPVQEAVTVELQFKKDADGKKAGGKKVRDKVYKMTFKNDAEMNKFMDTNAKILDEGTEELEESTPEYRKMLKDYEKSDDKKVFDILDKEGYRLGEQGSTLVRNMLKKFKGDVKKAAAFIIKSYPGMKKEDVQIDENAPATKIIDAAMKRIGIGFKVSGQVIKVNPLNVSRAKEELSKVLKRKGTDMNKTGMSVVKDNRIPVAESVELDESNIIDSLIEIAESCGEVD